ncbi:MAG: methyl-accepting chemotaxis protein [Synergistaceae bacterium]|jgi:methyl-accepting chemotaxis protein|nr:methyl-accepting chemotaxis protein [Synergistaceae bacterium]
MKFKGIMSRIIISVVPVITVSIILFAAIISNLMWKQINTQMNKNMSELLQKTELSIKNEFRRNESLSYSLAAYAKTVVDKGSINQNEIIDFSINLNKTYRNTFAYGIFLEPNIYRGREKFGIYTHWDASRSDIVFEANYVNEVDYRNENYYLIGKKSRGEAVWTDAYAEPLVKDVLITVSTPFFSDEGKMAGVCTVDMTLADIREIMSGISLGETGRAFILGRRGEYITFYDDTRTIDDLITNERDRNMADFGKTAVNSDEGMATVKTAEGSKRVFYKTLLETGWILVIMLDNSEIAGTILKLVINSVVAPIIGLLIATALLLMVASYLRRIAKKIISFATLAAEGDFSKKIEITEFDEFGTLEGHLNQMVENMGSIYAHSAGTNNKIVETSKRFSSLAQQTKDMVENFHTNIEDMETNLHALLASGEEVNAAVEEVSGGAQVMAEKGTNMANQVNSAMKAGEDGMNAVRHVVKDIEAVTKDASEVVQSVQELGSRARQIQSFVAQIGGIADQTNLLALNAAIEAARAGSAGRGFAVVAEEVRKLAEDSNAAAKNIATLAETITGDLGKVVTVSQSNAKGSEEAKNLSVKTEELINNMMKYLKDIASGTQDLAAVSEEQAASSEEIAVAVQNIVERVTSVAATNDSIHDDVGDAAASAEQMTHGAEDLARLASDMEAMLSSFTLSDTDEASNSRTITRAALHA